MYEKEIELSLISSPLPLLMIVPPLGAVIVRCNTHER